MFADLHLHSIYSDGTDSPNELIELAIANKIKVISITDHDSVAGHGNIAAARSADVKIIPAIEISTVLEHRYLHMLGYCIHTEADELAKYIQRTSDEKTENTRINFENAIRQGCFQYPWERVLELHQAQPRISGVHVVSSMQEDDYVIDGMGLWDMFNKYFRAESPDFIPTETATAYEAIDIIKLVGGIPVVAHPKSVGSDETIEDLIRYGAQGLEVFHPIHSGDDVLKYTKMAEKFGLYITGGTDWHGENNGANITGFGMCGLENDSYPILSIHA